MKKILSFIITIILIITCIGCSKNSTKTIEKDKKYFELTEMLEDTQIIDIKNITYEVPDYALSEQNDEDMQRWQFNKDNCTVYMSCSILDMSEDEKIEVDDVIDIAREKWETADYEYVTEKRYKNMNGVKIKALYYYNHDTDEYISLFVFSDGTNIYAMYFDWYSNEDHEDTDIINYATDLSHDITQTIRTK